MKRLLRLQLGPFISYRRNVSVFLVMLQSWAVVIVDRGILMLALNSVGVDGLDQSTDISLFTVYSWYYNLG